MDRIIGDKIIKNTSVVSALEYKPESHFIYEVIKVINGKMLFGEEHFKRLIISNDNKELGFNYQQLIAFVESLTVLNKVYNCNIKIVVDTKNFYVFFLKSYYPSANEHKQGCSVVSAVLSRHNPNKKQVNSNFREQANDIIKKNNVFEILLVNEDGFITEGSRSNVFFIKDEVVYTAPDELVLKGITRDKVIEAIRKLNLNIVYKPLHISEIENIDGAFLTGTSIDVYKIKTLDGKEYIKADKIINKIKIKACK